MSKMLTETFVVVAILASGCVSTYEHSELKSVSIALDSTEGVLISTPKDGWYGDKQYRDSGAMTARAIRSAFSRHVSKVDVVTTCHGDDCLASMDVEEFGYYVKPEILHWEDRATEWSGKRDRVEVRITIFDAATEAELASSSYTGTSKWATFGGDHPQDLLAEPTNKYVSGLYE